MDKNQIIGLVIAIIVLISIVPIIATFIKQSDDQRACTDPEHPYECLDLDDGLINWCSNESDGTVHCIDPDLPIYNVTTQLCTNASGVKVINATPTSVCDSFNWADGIVPYEDVGLTTTETTLLDLIILVLVLSVVIGFVIGSGILKKKQ